MRYGMVYCITTINVSPNKAKACSERSQCLILHHERFFQKVLKIQSLVTYSAVLNLCLTQKNNSASTFSNPMNELENLKPGFQHANVRAFNLCTFGGKKSGIEFDFTCVSEVDSFHPNAHAPQQELGICTKNRKAQSQP